MTTRRFGFTDTHPDAEAVQIRLLREAGPAARGALAVGMSEFVVGLSLSGLRKANPHLDERQLALKFIALTYGSELASKVRTYLEHRAA